MDTTETLDVTVLEPRLKHSTIFQKFDGLLAGEALIIHNDHDPMPLYYQLIQERGEIFSWDYESEGPEIWEVRITKKESDEAEAKIGKLVAKDFRKAEVFKKYGIDFCCGGGKTVKEACFEKGLNVQDVKKDLEAVSKGRINSAEDFEAWDPGFLADYIVNTHHNYVRNSLPFIFEITQKVANVHGGTHPETVQIADIFKMIMSELSGHMVKEEQILFPYIKKLSEAAKENNEMECSFGTIKNPVKVMEDDHTYVGSLMEKIRTLSNSFEPPAGACMSYKVSFAKLAEFEDDLHRHIHLENNILFPAAIELERKMNKNL